MVVTSLLHKSALDVAVNEWHLHVSLEDADSCNDDQLRQAVVYYDRGTRLFEVHPEAAAVACVLSDGVELN